MSKSWLLCSPARTVAESPATVHKTAKRFCASGGKRTNSEDSLLSSGTPPFRSLIYRFTNSILSFVKTQKELREVALSSNGFTLKDGLLILQTIVTNCQATLTDLEMVEFFYGFQKVHLNENFAAEFAKLKNLTHLGLSYGYLSNTLLENLES